MTATFTRRQGLQLGAAALAGAGALGLAGPASAQVPGFREGVHYERLPRRLPGTAGKVEVVEFFWYGCGHCFNFEPYLKDWVKTLPANVEFRLSHVFFRENTRAHQRLFFTLQAMGVEGQFREAIFNAIHREGNAMDTPAVMLKRLKPLGLDEGKFNAAWAAFEPGAFSAGRIQAANRLAEAYGLDGVPTLGIGGLYRTSPASVLRGERALSEADGAKRVLHLASELIKSMPNA